MKTIILNLSASLLLAASVGVGYIAPCAAAETTASSSSASESLKELEAQLDPVLKKHFPKAVIKKNDNSMHFEFKAQKYATTDSGIVLGPKTDGIVGDIEVKPGKHKGKHVMPLTTNETLYYSIAWWPYSTAKNSHLYIKLLFPHDVNIAVADEFKEALNSFAQGPEFVIVEKPIAPTERIAQPTATPQPTPQSTPVSTSQTTAPAAVAEKPAAASSAPELPADGDAKGAVNFDFGSALASGMQVAITASAAGADVKPIIENAEKEKAIVPKAPPKPTPEYFKGWFSKFYSTLGKANYIQEVTHFFTMGFRSTNLKGIATLDAAKGHAVYKVFKSQTYLSSWTIDKVQPGPGGCTDIIITGKTVEDHPAYIIYRMVADRGTWRIDSGRGRMWFTKRGLF